MAANLRQRKAQPRPNDSAGPDSSATAATPMNDSAEDVSRLIQETAYFKAKARDFAPGGELQDWLEAEMEVRRQGHGLTPPSAQ